MLLAIVTAVIGTKLAFFAGAGFLIVLAIVLAIARLPLLVVAGVGIAAAAWIVVSGFSYVENERQAAHAAGVSAERAVWIEKSEKAKAAADMAIAAAAVEGRTIAAYLEATILGLTETLRLNDEAAAQDPDADTCGLRARGVQRLNRFVPDP